MRANAARRRPDDDRPVAAPPLGYCAERRGSGRIEHRRSAAERVVDDDSIGASASSSLVTIYRASVRPADRIPHAREKPRRVNETTAAIPPRRARRPRAPPARDKPAPAAGTAPAGETRDETSPTEHATKRVGSGPEASAELHLGVASDTRGRRHAGLHAKRCSERPAQRSGCQLPAPLPQCGTSCMGCADVVGRR